MSKLYVLANEARVGYIASKAQRVVRSNAAVDIIQCTQSDRLTHLLSLANVDGSTFNHACFAIDGRDLDAIADFNAFLHVLRVSERVNASYPSVIRSINII